MKKNASRLTELKKFHDNQEFKTMKNKFLKFLKLHIINLKTNYNVIEEKRLQI